MTFNTYADFYDLFYRSKNYTSECRFVEGLFRKCSRKPVKTILDLGCGTGNHLIPFLKLGYQAVGLDASAKMLSIAGQKIRDAGFKPKLIKQDLKGFNLSEKFDALICMFSVIDYLTQEDHVVEMLRRVYKHLKPGGIFVCDFWNARAVESRFSPGKSKLYRFENKVVERQSRTILYKRKKLAKVKYRCILKIDGRTKLDFQEDHLLRYYTIEEMKNYLISAGLTPLLFCPFMKVRGKIRSNTWDVTVVAKKN